MNRLAASGGVRSSSGETETAALLATIDAGASGFTLCRIPAGVSLVGAAFDGVTALQVVTGVMRLSLPDKEALVARAGQLVLIPAGIRPHMAWNGARATRTVDGASLIRRRGWLVADAADGKSAELIVAAARITGTGNGSLTSVLVARLADLPEGRSALAMLRAELERAAAGSNTLAVTLMSLCIVVGLRAALAASGERGVERIADRRASIDRALAAVRSRPGDPHTIDTLARAAGMSRSTLTRHFRSVLNTTPAAFILRARLTEAAALLRATSQSVKLVAAQAGFADRSHFSRTFADAFGVDPTAYRRNAAAGSVVTVTERIKRVSQRGKT